MVNGSQCKISGAVGRAWGYAHAQWADDRVAALHVRGVCACVVVAHTQSDRNKAINRVSLLLVSIHFNPSLSGTMSRRRTATGPPLPTDCRTTPLSHAPYWPSIWTTNTYPMQGHGQTGQPACGSTTTPKGTNRQTIHQTHRPRKTRTPTLQPRDDSSASSSRYFLGIADRHPANRHRRRRRGDTPRTPSPSPQSSSSSSSSSSSESSRSRFPVTRRRRTTHHSHRHKQHRRRQHRRRHHSHARISVPISRSLREKIV